MTRAQIAIKTSERNELAQPENIDLLSPACEVRAIVTKQALQEGWDCPFAYVLCALAAGRNPSAMTQLVGRILRQPQVALTQRQALDECYVYCHDAKTADVISGIKKSLEQEGMGDLGLAVRAGPSTGGTASSRRLARRKGFESLRIFLPRVAWNEGGVRRELSYESDVLGAIDWEAIDPAKLARGWSPAAGGLQEQRLRIALQGWRRNRVYPDFVFARTEKGGRTLMVVMETKGAHLVNEDTEYKRRLLATLQSAWADERLQRAGELELVGKHGDRLMCDLVFDGNWRNDLTQRWFAEGA